MQKVKSNVCKRDVYAFVCDSREDVRDLMEKLRQCCNRTNFLSDISKTTSPRHDGQICKISIALTQEESALLKLAL